MLIIIQPSYSQRTKSSLSAGNQRHSEKSLKDNIYFFNFINTTVTNTGSDEEKAVFTEAVRRDLIARMLYMKFSFNPAMIEIRTTQQLLITLFRKIAVREIDNAKELLNEIAPEVLKTGRKSAKKYMSLGYRSADTAEKVKIMSDNLPEKNYSIILYEYVKSIKNAKFSKRYAIIAHIESRIPPEKKWKTNYNKYNSVRDLITAYITENSDKYIKIHSDNYYKIDNTRSVYDSITSNPELYKIPEYKNYIKDN